MRCEPCRATGEPLWYPVDPNRWLVWRNESSAPSLYRHFIHSPRCPAFAACLANWFDRSRPTASPATRRATVPLVIDPDLVAGLAVDRPRLRLEQVYNGLDVQQVVCDAP